MEGGGVVVGEGLQEVSVPPGFRGRKRCGKCDGLV